MRSEAWRKLLSVRPRESGGGNERRKETPRWSAERRASRVISAFTRVLTRYGTQGASRKRLACRGESAFTRVFHARWHAQRVLRTHPNVSRRSAHPRFGVSEA